MGRSLGAASRGADHVSSHHQRHRPFPWAELALLAEARPWAAAGLAGCVAALLAYPLSYRSIILSDEGVLLAQAADILNGKMLYRDMDAFVSPGLWYLLAGLFKVFEPTVWLGRAVTLVAFGCLAAVSCRLVMRFAGIRYGLGAVASLLILYVWAFPSWTFPFYSLFAVLFALLALECLLAWHEHGATMMIFAAGLCGGLAVAFKQNYGAYAVAGLGLSVLRMSRASRRNSEPGWRPMLAATTWFGAGILAAILPVVGYFASHGALYSLYENLVLHPFVFMAEEDIPYLPLWAVWRSNPLGEFNLMTYSAVPSYQIGAPLAWTSYWTWTANEVGRLHVLLYWIPVVVLGTGLLPVLRSIRRRRRTDDALLAVSLVAGGVFLGVFPRADFAHLVNVYQPAVVLAAILLHRGLRSDRHSGYKRAAVIALWFAIASYGSVAAYWYVGIITSPHWQLASRRGGVWLGLDNWSLNGQLEFLQQSTRPGENVLTVPDLTMLNFLAERPVPGRYYNLYQHHIFHDGGAQVVREAEEHGVRWAVARYNKFFSARSYLSEYAPDLWRYLRSTFDVDVVDIDDLIVFLRRRDQPRDNRVVNLLHSCQFGDPADIRRHLLFTTLTLYPDQVDGPVEVRCAGRVPPGGQLVFGVGYRRPDHATLGTVLQAEVWVLTSAGSMKLLALDLPVEPKNSWQESRWHEYSYDLSAFSGQDVTLVFQGLLAGEVESDPLKMTRFGLEWFEPRFESMYGELPSASPTSTPSDAGTEEEEEPRIEGRSPGDRPGDEASTNPVALDERAGAP
jgi:hypothetical protein